ncbi:hypothetical protein LJC14_05680, partial [Treponema sp. OttesenSCG-928-L16]|nr:hypothetical protein [Treponema sp. OttesenSCG-928-L16]
GRIVFPVLACQGGEEIFGQGCEHPGTAGHTERLGKWRSLVKRETGQRYIKKKIGVSMEKVLSSEQFQEVLDLAGKLEAGCVFLASVVGDLGDNVINSGERTEGFRFYNGLSFVLEMMAGKMGELYRLVNGE